MQTRERCSSGETSDNAIYSPSEIKCFFSLEGQILGEYILIVLFNGQIVLDSKWRENISLESTLPINIKDPLHQQIVANQPLFLLLRAVGGKGAKEPDPLLNPDNRAGATVDLFPLVLGERKICVTVPLISINSGENIGCSVEVTVQSEDASDLYKVPLLMTLVSAHCIPQPKEGTVFLGAVGLDDVLQTTAVDFGMSLSTQSATKVVWATASNGGYAANTAFNVPHDDIFISSDLQPQNTPHCKSVYWNSMCRVLVDPLLLRSRVSAPLFIEIAGVPRVGKLELRCRYMGFINANVLLEPAQLGVTTSAKLLIYNETDLPKCGPLLDLPPTSAKATTSARDMEFIKDEHGHSAYVILRFDLIEPLIPKTKMAWLYNTLGLPPNEGSAIPVYTFPPESLPEDPSLDARKIRKDGGALAIHRELGVLASRGAVHMGQSIKRTAASRLMMRVRTMIRQFPPGDFSHIEWQDTVTGQHATIRRAVTASFEPQPPPPRPPALFAASRCRIAGDTRIANHHIETLVAATAGHPRSLLSKALVYLEERKDDQAKKFYLQALKTHPKNKYLLWLFGGQEFDKDSEENEAASAALRITVKGDSSDGISKAISWAAVHTLHHYSGDEYAAFVAAKRMRKAYLLPREWIKFYERWVQITGEEEIFWSPTVIATFDPFLITAAFFLCLKCYHFTERLLQCVEEGCVNIGAHHDFNSKVSADVYYIRSASLLLRRQYDVALEITKAGIRRFGPCAILSQMQTSCLACIHGWDTSCEASFLETDRAGAQQCPVLLLRAAWGCFLTDPGMALQRVARCHMVAPGGHSALLIGRIYAQMGDGFWAGRWAAEAVEMEPLLADGWALLATLAMRDRDVERAKAMIRTAKQAGPISPDLKKEMDDLMEKLRMHTLLDALVKDVCYCDSETEEVPVTHLPFKGERP